MKRKSPIRHLVSSYTTKKGKSVRVYERGKGKLKYVYMPGMGYDVRKETYKEPKNKIANPEIKFNLDKNTSINSKTNEIANEIRKLFRNDINPEDVEIQRDDTISVDTSTTSFKQTMKDAGWKVNKIWIDNTHSYVAKKKGYPTIECSRVYDPEEDEDDN